MVTLPILEPWKLTEPVLLGGAVRAGKDMYPSVLSKRDVR